MEEVKVQINTVQKDFLSKHSSYGFKDESSLVTNAIDYFRKKLEEQTLKKSADLYSEIYIHDKELQNITDSAISDWITDENLEIV